MVKLARLRKKIAYALTHPRYTTRVLIDEFLDIDERWIANVSHLAVSQIEQAVTELYNDSAFIQALDLADDEIKRSDIAQKGAGANIGGKKSILQYIITRCIRPLTVVETGVANGISSCYILYALHKNNRGKLYSIDLPNTNTITGEQRAFIPLGKEPGWVVPYKLRDRWELLLGDAKELLPSLLEEVNPLDIFIHDSSHTYEHMSFEYNAAWKYLRSGGILISDDVSWNMAFEHFKEKMKPKKCRITRGIGIMIK